MISREFNSFGMELILRMKLIFFENGVKSLWDWNKNGI
jgi:hypothetical protein